MLGRLIKKILKPGDVWIAAEYGDVQTIKAFASKGGNLNCKRGELGWTPLHVAARAGQVQAITELVGLGANINERDAEGGTALILAIQENAKLEVLNHLLQLGADVNKRDKSRMTALDYAASKGSLDLFRFLIERGASLRSGKLVCCIQGGNSEILKLLVAAKADLDALQWGRSPLSQAVVSGRKDFVELLIDAGAKLEQTDEDPSGRTPLLIAVALGNFEIVKLLASSGANINVINKFTEESPLDVANFPPQNKEVADYLCGLGAKSAKEMGAVNQ